MGGAKTGLITGFFFAVSVFSAPARADTDYRCLNLCSQAGKPAMTCLRQCDYDSPVAKKKTAVPSVKEPAVPETQDLSNHRILQTIKPLSDVDASILAQQKQVPVYHETKDYKCMTQCLNDHMQYETCNKKCTVTTTVNGKIILPDMDKK